MSTIKVQRIEAGSDDDFRINLPSNAHLNINGGFATTADGKLKIPVGTTDQRPSTPVAGQIRFNTTLNTVEGYNGTVWSNLMFEDVTAEAEETTTTGSIPQRSLVFHLDPNDERSMAPQASVNGANIIHNLVDNDFNFAFPTDRIITESINNSDVRLIDLSVNGVGCMKLNTGRGYTDVPHFYHASVVMFLRWRTSNDQWRTPLRSRNADHQIIVQSGNRNLGMYDNNGQGFQDSGYDIDQFPDWDTKVNMYTWLLSNTTSGQYSPCYQCYFKDEANPRATINNGNAQFNRGFHHVGAWGSGNINPHSSSQNSGTYGPILYYGRHITLAERTEIYNYYKDTYDI